MLKLQNLVDETTSRMERYINEEGILKFRDEGRENHWYIKDHSVWFANIVIHTCYSPDEICEIYKKYNCNDSHITSLAIYCCKKKGWL